MKTMIKTLFLGFFSLLFTAISVQANDLQDLNAESIMVSDANKITIDLALDIDTPENTQHSDKIMNDLLNALGQYEDLECTITVTLNVGVPVFGGSVSLTISGDCDEVVAEAAKQYEELKKKFQ